jgi:tetratricopeptide (TPR) repeat protein
LEVDPNLENAFGWHQAIHRERGGEVAETRELKRIAEIPGSWRAQLWLARAALKSQHFEKALALYRESMKHTGRPVPTDLLMQMSGDLGNHGHLAEILQLAEPEFVPNHHGILVGNNIINAHLDLGQIEAASKVLEQLYNLRRPDWKDQLAFWDTTIAKARIARSSIDLTAPIESSMLIIDGPVWLKPSSPATSLFPRSHTREIFVSFLGGSVTTPRESDQIHLQLSDSPGRLTRAVPLYLAEQVYFQTEILVQTMVPWIKEERGAFMVSGRIWPDADAARYAKMAQPKSQFVALTHLVAEAEGAAAPWEVQLRLIRTIDAECVATLEGSFSPSDPENGLLDLSRRMITMLAHHTEATVGKPSPIYHVPGGKQLSDYLLRIEQLLAIRCAVAEGQGPDSLSGVREILDGMIVLCLSCRSNAVVRILLAETVLAMWRIRPDVAAEFKEKVERLQKESRLSDPAQAMVQWILDEVPHSRQ